MWNRESFLVPLILAHEAGTRLRSVLGTSMRYSMPATVTYVTGDIP